VKKKKKALAVRDKEEKPHGKNEGVALAKLYKRKVILGGVRTPTNRGQKKG